MEEKLSKRKFLNLVIIFYIILYIIFKLTLVYFQDLYMSNDIYEKEYGIGNVINISSYSKDEKKKIDYFSNKSDLYKMKVKNYFNDFEAGDYDSNYEYYMLYDEDENIEAIFMMGMFDTNYSKIFLYNSDSIFYEFNYFPLYISYYLRDNYLKKYNINNEIDLIKYVRKRKKSDCNFFTPISKIKENYFFNFVENSFPDLSNITYIEGDFNGYIYEVNDYKQACILKDDKLYCLTFYKLNYFDDDKIIDILKSLEIEK